MSCAPTTSLKKDEIEVQIEEIMNDIGDPCIGLKSKKTFKCTCITQLREECVKVDVTNYMREFIKMKIYIAPIIMNQALECKASLPRVIHACIFSLTYEMQTGKFFFVKNQPNYF